MKKNILTLLLLVFTCSVFAQTVFFEGTLDQAIKKAQDERKYLFVDCYTDWCSWCKVADTTTFQSAEVGNFLNKRFVAIKLDMERNEGIDLGMRYRVFGFPSFLIFSPEGFIVNRFFGYTKDDSEFVSKLKNGMAEEKKYRYKSNIKDLVKLPDFYTKSFTNKDQDHKRESPEPLQIEKWLSNQTDLSSEVAWCVISRFKVDNATTEQFLGTLTKYRKLYGEEEVRNKVVDIANDKFDELMDKDREHALDAAVKFLDKYLIDEKEKQNFKENFQLKYAEIVGNWKLYLKVASRKIYEGSIKIHLNEANSFAWTLYKKSDNLEVLSAARDWMSRVVEIDPSYAFTDTYAALLYKTGAYDEAATVALSAIEIGKANDEKTDETEELLEKIRKAQKKK